MDNLFSKNSISVIIDNDPNLGYEKVNWFYYLFVLPSSLLLALWVAFKKMILGKNLKINTFWFDGGSPLCREVKENATRWKALDIIYNYAPVNNKDFSWKITNFWNQLKNIKALRNRLKLVQKELTEIIENLALKKSEIKLISIASGSAQGVINVMKEFKRKGLIIKAIFLDLDPTAIDHSKTLANQAGVMGQITFVNKSARELEDVAKNFNPDVVEVVGFIEYRPKERAINLVKRIYNLLGQGGVLLISSVSPSLEIPFIHFVSNWPEIYRNLNQFIEILIKGGFKPSNIKIIYEPLKVQKIAVCQKD